ncbi:hypothetical protein KKJ09_02025 [Xenorhabdus bovienii]|uniref:hypothetical protein n=1 Tax=Xenorhabdus bovienii TaxID=40576 RepID=UPI0023B2AF27|nr:hypothetical protein [Xenorhabdus bovienii]MDE9492405.1 hypothetical protein [Xenorhabdus bovienii]MDE9500932.1 hypothetical protein [Xenorhabdus bovienii]MDE9524598.1 hypothetical protein [Xenorhabdus bovienii]MDE9567889.1 hypothetical protein [Xenorhabdus bovienii]
MPFDFKETAEEKMRSMQPCHSTDGDRDSAISEIVWDSNDMFRNGSVSLDQAKDPTFWKENIADYYKWMGAVKEQLKMLDLSLKAMDSPESLEANTAKNIGSITLRAAINTGASLGGAAAGAALGTVMIPIPVVGTLLGTGLGMGIGTGINLLGNMAVDKLDEKLKIAHPYPKTRNMIFDINNYDKNFVTKAIKKNFQKDNLKVTVGSGIVSGIAGKLSPVKVPVYKLADLAVSHNKSSEPMKKDKSQHILDFTHDITEVLNESHSDAVTFMRKNYGNSEMSIPGISAKIKGSKLTSDKMVKKKNQIEIKISSINKQVEKLSRLNRD